MPRIGTIDENDGRRGERVGTIFDGEHGQDLAKSALKIMERHGISPSPENYFVFASHASGQVPELSRELNELMLSGEGLTSEHCAKLYVKHCTQGAIADTLAKTGGDVESQLGDAIDALKAAGRNTREYGETLEGASGQLEKTSDPDVLRRMVASLVDATQKMQAHTNKLEAKLQETTREVESLRVNLEQVREEAMTDALTGVANRKRFDEFIQRTVENGKAGQTALIIADIDHFKSFNDNWGHQTGDQIIRFVAAVLSKHAPEGALVARYGGEEFAIVLPGVALDDANATAEQIRESVERKVLMRKSTNEQLGTVTISLGIASHRDGESSWEFIERADNALYVSKSNGRNQTTIDGGDVAAAQHAA